LRLRYTRRAAAELDEVLELIARQSPKGGASVQKRLFEVFRMLVLQPEAGQRAGQKLRRFVVFPYPYVVFYRIEGDWITIHGVRHAARRPITP
jgi:plasmid stabilization system protein ParE